MTSDNYTYNNKPLTYDVQHIRQRHFWFRVDLALVDTVIS